MRYLQETSETAQSKNIGKSTDNNMDDLTHKTSNALALTLDLCHMTPIEEFLAEPTTYSFCKIGSDQLTEDFLCLAMRKCSSALKYVPKGLLSEEVCKAAVSCSGDALEYIPKEYYSDELFSLAVRADGLALRFVPANKIDSQLALLAVNSSMQSYDSECPLKYVPRKLITKRIVTAAVKSYPHSVKYVPDRFLTDTLLLSAVSSDGAAIEFISPKRLTTEIINTALASCPAALEFLPTQKKTQARCIEAFSNDHSVLAFIPSKFITKEMCISALSEEQTKHSLCVCFLYTIPQKFRNDLELVDIVIKKIGAEYLLRWLNYKSPSCDSEETYDPKYALNQDTIKHLLSCQKRYNISIEPADYTQMFQQNRKEFPVSNPESRSEALCLEEDDPSKTIFNYITDIHIEHQLKSIAASHSITSHELHQFIDNKIDELLSTAAYDSEIILVGGDVSNYRQLTKLFYRRLSEKWKGSVVFVIGNHEVWDYPLSESTVVLPSMLSVDQIPDLFRKISYNCHCLHNSVYIKYKNRYERVIGEDDILSANDADLREICSASPFIILGGLGFSGFNLTFNAEYGLYQNKITTLEEDIAQTQRFSAVYNKVLGALGDKQVIVLTHTPVHNWTKGECNPNWVYINGHTHSNELVRLKDGTTILSDGQIGYAPKKWAFKHFSFGGWYDPFEQLPDGIHMISRDDYLLFNQGRGITIRSCKYQGRFWAIKKNNFYMFVLESNSGLCLLEGGYRHKLSHKDISYYYSNIDKYRSLIEEQLSPYRNALIMLSKEVKQFGGSGNIHGCIVDIDFYNHIYLDPFTGLVKPYYAIDIIDKYFYNDLPSLLNANAPALFSRFTNQLSDGKLPILGEYAVLRNNHRNKALIHLPRAIHGTEMYVPSRIMRSAQYLFDKNVIRFWNDTILAPEESEEIIAINGSKKILLEKNKS